VIKFKSAKALGIEKPVMLLARAATASKCFVRGDTHFNAVGHRLLLDEPRSFVGGY